MAPMCGPATALARPGTRKARFGWLGPHDCGTQALNADFWCSVPYHKLDAFPRVLEFQGFSLRKSCVVRYRSFRMGFWWFCTTVVRYGSPEMGCCGFRTTEVWCGSFRKGAQGLRTTTVRCGMSCDSFSGFRGSSGLGMWSRTVVPAGSGSAPRSRLSSYRPGWRAAGR